MKLQTEISIQGREPKITYASRIFLLGSCFSENIGGKFQFYKFRSLQNPFGILFHPFAMETFLKNVAQQKVYTKNDLVFQNEAWHCFEAHSRLSSPDQKEIVQRLNNGVQKTREFLKKTTHVFLTFGTAWVYRHRESGKYVANCHKIPQQQFEKQLIASGELQESMRCSVKFIQQINPTVKFVFSISPVRHVKDGMVANQQSKAKLMDAVHGVIASEKNAFYFPSYEILLDELRDYRFYAEDLVHPNKTAVEYIWEKFSEAWIASKAKRTMKEVETIQRGLEHKPFNPTSGAHQKFLTKLQQKKETLLQDFPHIEF